MKSVLSKDRELIEKFNHQIQQITGKSVVPESITFFEHWLLDDEQQMMLSLNPWHGWFIYAATVLIDGIAHNPNVLKEFKENSNAFGIQDKEQIRIISELVSNVLDSENEIPGSRMFEGKAVNLTLLSGAVRLAFNLDINHVRTAGRIYKEGGLDKTLAFDAFLKHYSVESSGPHPYLSGTIRLVIRCTRKDVHHALKKHENRLQKMLHQLNQQISPRFLFSDVIFEIQAESYEPMDMKFSVDSMAALSLFTGNRLYSDRRVFLRELVQNAVDACNLTRIFDSDHEADISIRFDNDQGIITFSDNGIGMDRQWMEKYFLKIGISFYQSGDLKHMNQSHLDFNFISKFGIGFLSSFLVSDKIIIKTRKKGQAGLVITISNLQEYFDVRLADEDCPVGTHVSLYLRETKNKFSRFMDYVCYLKTNMRYLSIPVSLTDHQGQTTLLGNERLAYDIDSHWNCDYVTKLGFPDSEGYLFLKTKQNQNRFYGLEFAHGGVSIFQDGIFVTQTATLLPEGARGSIIGRINLTGKDRCELSMDRNRIFWTEAQLHGIKRLIRLGIVDLANQVMTEKPGLNPAWQIDKGLINHLAIFFDFNEIDDEMYQTLGKPVRQILAKRFRDFIRIHFAHTGDQNSVPDADGYAEAWQQEILATFSKRSRPPLPAG